MPISLPIVLPRGLKWSCHGCGNCCRQYEIVVSDAERQRIVDQKWTAADGVPAGMKAFEGVGRMGARKYRLAHRADGSCVFLDKNNRCRIHARFGEAAKPLACRVFPFAFHVVGDQLAVSLRFSCPSVAGNEGTALEPQRGELSRLRDLAVSGELNWPAPAVAGSQQLDWPDTLRIVRRLRRLLCDDSQDLLSVRLAQALFVAGMLGQATFDKVRGERLDELMDALLTAAPLETAASIQEGQEPSRLGRAQFRLTVAQYATRDTTAAGGLGYRVRRMLAGLRFARGRGQTPAMQPALRPVAFAKLEEPANASRTEIDELFQRYFNVKLTGMGFCGRACYDLPVVEGFYGLVLTYPVAMYITRWIARGQGRASMTLGDAQQALSMVDHHHGYSPLMGQSNFRQRVRWLAKQGELARLIGWYAR